MLPGVRRAALAQAVTEAAELRSQITQLTADVARASQQVSLACVHVRGRVRACVHPSHPPLSTC